MGKLNLFIAFIIISHLTSAQDTLRIMTYNLMNYGYYPSYCNASINDIDDKNTYITTIIDNTLPDIVGFVEVDNNGNSNKYRLLGALNSNGRDYYNFTAYNNGDGLSGLIFYNENKLDFISAVSVFTDEVRDMMIYSFKKKNSEAGPEIHIVLAHLKAGYDCEVERKNQINALYDKLEDFGNNNNYILMGDLNFYGHDEDAFDKISRHSNVELRFIDPVNELGDSNFDFGNYSNRQYHSQSTCTDYYNDCTTCFATGGLDDRFDFILVDDDIISGESQVKYIEDSYTTLGQDGNHYNDYLSENGNNSAPSTVIEALQKNSDHLPVYADFVFGEPASIASTPAKELSISCSNPVNENLILTLKSSNPIKVDLTIYNMLGDPLIQQTQWVEGNKKYSISTSHLASGLYFINARTNKGMISVRFVKE